MKNSSFDKKEDLMQSEAKEDLKRRIEKISLTCDCGEKVYRVGTGAVEDQANYNKYFEYLECPKCHTGILP
jgi:uncharacterized protein with PIN domain